MSTLPTKASLSAPAATAGRPRPFQQNFHSNYLDRAAQVAAPKATRAIARATSARPPCALSAARLPDCRIPSTEGDWRMLAGLACDECLRDSRWHVRQPSQPTSGYTTQRTGDLASPRARTPGCRAGCERLPAPRGRLLSDRPPCPPKAGSATTQPPPRWVSAKALSHW